MRDATVDGASVGGAWIAVVHRDRGPGLTSARRANTSRVATIGGLAHRAVRDRNVLDPAGSAARIGRTSVVVIEAGRSAAHAAAAAVAGLLAVAGVVVFAREA